MLRMEHLTKVYGDKKAVDDLSLHIQPGEIYGFIGHNGAGKTTTLKSVVGILQFDAGVRPTLAIVTAVGSAVCPWKAAIHFSV